MAALVIDTMQQRDVAIFGVPGDFLKNALQEDKFLLMQIRDELLYVICEGNHEYIPYVIYENGNKGTVHKDSNSYLWMR